MKRLFVLLFAIMLFAGYMPAEAAMPITDDAIAYGYCKANGINYLPHTDDYWYGCYTTSGDDILNPEMVADVQYLAIYAIGNNQDVVWDTVKVEYMTAYMTAQEYFKDNPKELDEVTTYITGCKTRQDAIKRALGK